LGLSVCLGLVERLGEEGVGGVGAGRVGEDDEEAAAAGVAEHEGGQAEVGEAKLPVLPLPHSDCGCWADEAKTCWKLTALRAKVWKPVQGWGAESHLNNCIPPSAARKQSRPLYSGSWWRQGKQGLAKMLVSFPSRKKAGMAIVAIRSGRR
jgi:hypothetical protein